MDNTSSDYNSVFINDVSVKIEPETRETSKAKDCNVMQMHEVCIKSEPDPDPGIIPELNEVDPLGIESVELYEQEHLKRVLVTLKEEYVDELDDANSFGVTITNNEGVKTRVQGKGKHGKRKERPVGKQFTCSKCNYKTKVKQRLKQHECKNSSGELFYCFKCKYKTHRKKQLIKHQGLHPRQKMFTCTFCDKTYTIRLHLDEHLLYVHKSEPNIMELIKSPMYQCTSCSYQSVRTDQLQTHMMNHKDQAEELFSCKSCDYKSYHKGNYNQHLMIHNERKSFVCGGCGREFNQKVSMYSHIVNHHSDDDVLMATLTCKIRQCPHCSFRCVMNTQYLNHMQSNHSDL